MPVELGSITLMRHGHVPKRGEKQTYGEDVGLTPLGRTQVFASAEVLKGANINVIYSSPLIRAKQSADIVASRLGIAQVLPHSGLVERDLRGFRGMPVSEVDKYAETLTLGGRKYIVRSRDGREDGIEPLPAAYDRAKAALEEISSNHPEENVLLVTHAVTGRMLYAAHNNLSWREGLEAPFDFSNASILKLS